MDPSLSIAFRAEIPYAIGGNAISGKTIRIFGLDDRPALIEDRLTLLTYLVLLKKNRDMLAGEIADGGATRECEVHLVELDSVLADCILDSAEYAAMARDAMNVI